MNINRFISKLKSFLLTNLVWIIIIVIDFPLVWMISTSFKQRVDVYAYPPKLFSTPPTLIHYIELFKMTNFGRYFLNSAIITISTVVMAALVSLGAVYALTRFKIKGSFLFQRAIILIYLLPSAILVIPIFVIMRALNLTDSFIGIILVYMSFTVPYNFLMLRSYVATIGRSIEEAAFIDGATKLGAFVKVTIPIAFPGIIATSIFTASLSWNELLYALVMLVAEDKKTLPVGTSTLIDAISVPSWGMLMAAATVITIPMLVFFVLVQKNMVVGIGSGALKE